MSSHLSEDLVRGNYTPIGVVFHDVTWPEPESRSKKSYNHSVSVPPMLSHFDVHSYLGILLCKAVL